MKLYDTAILEIKRPNENVNFCSITLVNLTERSYISLNLTKECAYSFRSIDRYIGYLPLAHIMEMVCGESCKDVEVSYVKTYITRMSDICNKNTSSAFIAKDSHIPANIYMTSMASFWCFYCYL